MSRTNYVYIDFENVQETDLDRIANKQVKVRLILGQQQKNLPVKVVKLIQKYPEQVCLIETELTGKHALDFVLASEVGAESEKDPGGYFHVLSRDKGFDALIRHLRGKGIHAARHTAFSEIPLLMNLAERLILLPAHFKANEANRPKTLKTLEPYIQTTFGRALSPEEIQQTIEGLVSAKVITLSGKGAVTYTR